MLCRLVACRLTALDLTGHLRSCSSERKDTMFGFLKRLFGTDSKADDEVIGGSGAVFNAILENIDGDKRYVTVFGEPELVDRGGQYSTDYMVRIPTFTQGGDPEPPNIEYDLPDGEMGEASNELFDLLDYFDIQQVSDLGDLEGEEIMAAFESGVLSFQFDGGAE